MAFGLLFATWDITRRTIGRCGLELLLFEQGKLSDYRAPLRRGLDQDRTGADYEVFARALRPIVEKFRERWAEVLESVDEHTRTFLDGRAWAPVTPEGLVEAVLTGPEAEGLPGQPRGG